MQARFITKDDEKHLQTHVKIASTHPSCRKSTSAAGTAGRGRSRSCGTPSRTCAVRTSTAYRTPCRSSSQCPGRDAQQTTYVTRSFRTDQFTGDKEAYRLHLHGCEPCCLHCSQAPSWHGIEQVCSPHFSSFPHTFPHEKKRAAHRRSETAYGGGVRSLGASVMFVKNRTFPQKHSLRTVWGQAGHGPGWQSRTHWWPHSGRSCLPQI